MENERKKGKIRTFWSDFKKFIGKGNIIDLAVAVVIGAAFNKIVSSLVNDIIMPLISLAVGGASVKDWKWVIKEAVYDENAVLITAETSLNYGVFIQAIIDFLIIAFTLFVVIKILSASSKRLEKMGQDIKTLTKKSKKQANKEIVEENIETVENTQENLKTTEEIKVEEVKPEVIEQVNTHDEKSEQTKILEEIRDLLIEQNKK